MGGPGSGAKPKQYPSDLVSQVSALYAEGRTQAEIGAAVGLSQKIVWNLMRRHGIQARVAAKRNQRGELNHAWKGDDAGYKALHLRVARLRGKPEHCENCGQTGPGHYDWANLTGRYEDANDYRRLCRSCHWKLDDKVANFSGGGGAA